MSITPAMETRSIRAKIALVPALSLSLLGVPQQWLPRPKLTMIMIRYEGVPSSRCSPRTNAAFG